MIRLRLAAAIAKIAIRVASVIKAGSPMALAKYGNAIRQTIRATRPTNGHGPCAVRIGARRSTLSLLRTEQSFRPDQEHKRHHQIDSHGRKTGSQRIGL